MIASIRIDERLIHGQVAVAWCTTLGVDSIVVANNKAASDSVSIMSLKMAAPQHIKVVVKSIDDAIRILNDQRIKQKKVLLLVTNPKDVLTLIKNVDGIPSVNIGNYGMLDDEPNRTNIAVSFSVNDMELRQFKEIINLRPKSYYQMTPTLTPRLLSELLDEERKIT